MRSGAALAEASEAAACSAEAGRTREPMWLTVGKAGVIPGSVPIHVECFIPAGMVSTCTSRTPAWSEIPTRDEAEDEFSELTYDCPTVPYGQLLKFDYQSTITDMIGLGVDSVWPGRWG